MKTYRLAPLAILLQLATGCAHHTPVVTVEVIDVSESITPRAEAAALNAVGAQISHLGRGDRLILIPITSDAQNDAGGKILRLTAPTTREAYDSDLQRFQKEAKKQFCAWLGSLNLREPQTDILGTLEIARQELASVPAGSQRQLVIVSDFLEDESTYNFVKTPELRNPSRARQFAAAVRAERGFALPGVSVCLGRLESSDFMYLSPQRKEAVQAFWAEYLSDKDHAPELHFDGTGLLSNGGCPTPPQSAATN